MLLTRACPTPQPQKGSVLPVEFSLPCLSLRALTCCGMGWKHPLQAGTQWANALPGRCYPHSRVQLCLQRDTGPCALKDTWPRAAICTTGSDSQSAVPAPQADSKEETRPPQQVGNSLEMEKATAGKHSCLEAAP